jgi:hypothetical protein
MPIPKSGKTKRAPRTSRAVRFFQRVKRARGNKCESCGRKGTRRSPLHCAHVESVQARPDLQFRASNIRVLCQRCHSREQFGHAVKVPFQMRTGGMKFFRAWRTRRGSR